MNMMDTTTTRLNKFISESGICSRREADQYIEQGQVQINGRRAKIGDQVSVGDRVMVNGQLIAAKEPDSFVFLAVNKPVGVTCTTEEGVKNNIVDLVGYPERIFHIGRLDKDSQGLIFMTNNGDIVNKILRAGNQHEKEYIVTVDKPVTDAFVERMSKGVPILGVVTKKCKIERVSAFVFRIILVQGLNRQIRRMCEYLGYQVTKLERIRIMNISLKGIPLGGWRDLTAAEMADIFSSIAHSSSTEEASKSSGKNPRKAPQGATKARAPQKMVQAKVPQGAARSTKAQAPKTSASGAKPSVRTSGGSAARPFNPKARELRGKPSTSGGKKQGSGKNSRGVGGNSATRSKGHTAKR